MEVVLVFLPLIGAIIAGFLGHRIGDRGSQLVTCGLMILSAILAVVVFFDVAISGNYRTTELFTWFDSGAFEASWAVKLDTLSAVMLLVVTICSSVIHVYSIGYMAHDKSVPRFMGYLSLFTFFMLMLATSDNFVQMFFGWEGVGVCSYFLIGFWYERPSANAAAIKAFLVNRVGDIGFALGIAGTFFVFGAVNFEQVFQAVPGMVDVNFAFLGIEGHAITIICILLFIGAMGKSAQLGLHTWLPDAMEGPTPVSALIHAATMVTAGVFMVCRLSYMFEYAPIALDIVTYIGAVTCLLAATIGIAQNDIKRVIAYSTCSQLGYMFFAAGVSAYEAAMFHLSMHAAFKALLFLCAGSVIHAMSDDQDMRRMGGLWRIIPYTYGLMWIGSLALAGIPPFSGYFSKDIMIEAAYGAHTGVGLFAYWFGTAAAFLTALYSGRLLFMTFHGNQRASARSMAHAHESPRVMIWPLFVLAFFAIFGGWLGADMFVGDGREAFWRDSVLVLAGNDSLEAAHHVPTWVKLMPLIAAVSGFAIALWMYILQPGMPHRLVAHTRPVYLLLLNKWYFDELYDLLFVRPARYLGYGLWKSGDGAVIDGVGPDGIAAATRSISRRTSLLQSGYVYHYAFAMLIGVVVLITWYLLSRQG